MQRVTGVRLDWGFVDCGRCFGIKADVDTNIDPQEKSKSYDTVAGARFQLFRRIENEKEELEGRKRERGFSISPEIETKRRERYML
jgi:hypothetical protein